MKRLIICCDGTWQNLNNDNPTNVVKLLHALDNKDNDGINQITYYDSGIGSESTGVAQLIQGAFGWGLEQAVRNAYRFLCLNYQKGDQVYLFGFSRGAYTIRSLAGLIYSSGLLARDYSGETDAAYQIYRDEEIHPDDDEAIIFRKNIAYQIDIDFMGCWDTVGSLGIPDLTSFLPFNDMINKRYQFHDTKISERIKHARHAVGIDEKRKVFDVTPMTLSTNAESKGVDLKEMWFTGEHSCIGGGDKNTEGLSDITLEWMISECESTGLGIQFNRNNIIGGIDSDHMQPFNNSLHGIYRVFPDFSRTVNCSFDLIHPTTVKRWTEDKSYRPDNLHALMKHCE